MGPGSRRKNLTAEDVDQMRALEAEGKSRKQIANSLNCTPACVTRKLGAVRPYRFARRPPGA